MEDLQLLIYILFGIIYLIFGALKKRRKGGGDTSTPPIFQEEEPQAGGTYHQEPRSLEELLDRYEQAAQRAKRRAGEKAESMQEQIEEQFQPTAASLPQHRNLEAEALEQMQRTERLKSVQEELPARARAEAMQRDPMLMPSAAIGKLKQGRDRKKRMPRREPGMAAQIRALAGTRKGMQQAVILSEVLNRKYF